MLIVGLLTGPPENSLGQFMKEKPDQVSSRIVYRHFSTLRVTSTLFGCENSTTFTLKQWALTNYNLRAEIGEK